MSVPYDDDKLPTPACEHEWKDSYCTKCEAECACVSGDTAMYDEGQCTCCGYECEHADTDDYCCLDCGKELLEDRMAAAYDRYKDSKYGD